MRYLNTIFHPAIELVFLQGWADQVCFTLPVMDDPTIITLQLEMEDSGSGIVAEQLDRIFEPFAQAGRTPGMAKGIYETAMESATHPAKQPLDMEKAKALVSSLPDQLCNKLEEAFTLLLVVEASYALIKDVHKVAPELADILKMYVDEFDFYSLQKVIAGD
jgi:hypothetical protein